MTKIVRKYTSYILFLIAVTITLSGIAGYFIMSSEVDSRPIIKGVQKELLEGDESRQERIDNAVYDDEVDFASGSDIAEAKKHYSSTIEEFGIGSVYMPTSGISVPILAGTSEWNLFNGVGTARAEQELGEGLFIGLSHNLVNDRLLKKIDLVSAGDFIYATDFVNVYAYQVIDQKVVHETNKQYFQEPGDGESGKMLLYRCEGKRGTDWRRALYSEHIETLALSDVEADVLEGLGVDVEIEEVKTIKPSAEPKDVGFLDKWIGKFADFIGQYKGLNDYFLSVYSMVDNHPMVFGVFIFILFILYGIL